MKDRMLFVLRNKATRTQMPHSNLKINAAITSERDSTSTARNQWTLGAENYERVSRGIADAIDHAIDRLQVSIETPILDIATGTGLTARKLAERGHTVSGLDIAPSMVTVARTIAADLNVEPSFELGDAEALPLTNASVEAVISTFGLMFAPDQKAVASELARVTKPGAQVVLANWRPDSTVHNMFQIFSAFRPNSHASVAPSPFNWGDKEYINELLGKDFTLTFEDGASWYREPNASAAWATFSNGYGPTISLLKSLSPTEGDQVRKVFEDFHNEYSTDLGISMPRKYLIVQAIRR
jgi:ubiquinone/menaquinone biosynthesis C-methylase UbiE